MDPKKLFLLRELFLFQFLNVIGKYNILNSSFSHLTRTVIALCYLNY